MFAIQLADKVVMLLLGSIVNKWKNITKAHLLA